MPVLLSLLMLAGPSALEDYPEFRKAIDAYENLEYEQAIFRFQKLAAKPGLDSNDRGEAFFFLAQSYAGIGEFDAARDAFHSALSENSMLSLPAGASPRLTDMVGEVRRELMAESRAQSPDSPDEGALEEPSAVAAPPVAAAGPSVLLISGAAMTATGGAALIAAAVLGGLAYGEVLYIREPGRYQQEAKDAQDRANLELIGATVAGALGVALVAGGGALVAVDLLE